jgi:hypothetical protein
MPPKPLFPMIIDPTAHPASGTHSLLFQRPFYPDINFEPFKVYFDFGHLPWFLYSH